VKPDMRALLKRTGLTDSQVSRVFAVLNAQDAVIFGSAVTYAYLGVDLMNGANPVNDIDVLVKSESIRSALTAIFCEVPGVRGCAPEPDYDDSWYNNVQDFDNGHYVYLKNAKAPTGAQQIGNITWGYYTDEYQFTLPRVCLNNVCEYTGRAVFPDSFSPGYVGAGLTMPGDGSAFAIRRVQFPLASEFGSPRGSLVDFVAQQADFTVAAGSFDGTTLHMPFADDLCRGITTYREVIDASGGKTNKHVDWVLYRLAKWASRGFVVYFKEQSQINAWNTAFWAYSSGYTRSDRGSDASKDFWYSEATFSRPPASAVNVCPYTLRTAAIDPAINDPVDANDPVDPYSTTANEPAKDDPFDCASMPGLSLRLLAGSLSVAIMMIAN